MTLGTINTDGLSTLKTFEPLEKLIHRFNLEESSENVHSVLFALYVH